MASSILNSDDGVISGTSGLKSTGGDDGVTTFQQNGTERMRVDSSGRVLIGTTSATNNLRLSEKLAVVHAGADYPGMAITGYTGTNGGIRPLFEMQRSRGTTDGSFTKVESGDTIGSFIFRGADGSAFRDAAEMSVIVSGATGASDMPGTFLFSTSADGSSSPAERMRITSDGYLRLAGGGIQFNGDTAAANALDDYEEGTWTPSLGGNTTYNEQAGNYVKIGKMVFVEGHLYINVIGTGSTSLVSGLPFTSAAQPTGVRATLSVNYFNTVANNIIYPALYLNASATTAQFQAIAAAGTTMSTIGIFGNSTDIYFSGCYYAAT